MGGWVGHKPECETAAAATAGAAAALQGGRPSRVGGLEGRCQGATAEHGGTRELWQQQRCKSAHAAHAPAPVAVPGSTSHLQCSSAPPRSSALTSSPVAAFTSGGPPAHTQPGQPAKPSQGMCTRSKHVSVGEHPPHPSTPSSLPRSASRTPAPPIQNQQCEASKTVAAAKKGCDQEDGIHLTQEYRAVAAHNHALVRHRRHVGTARCTSQRQRSEISTVVLLGWKRLQPAAPPPQPLAAPTHQEPS